MIAFSGSGAPGEQNMPLGQRPEPAAEPRGA